MAQADYTENDVTPRVSSPKPVNEYADLAVTK
jgi:hypothetical protein